MQTPRLKSGVSALLLISFISYSTIGKKSNYRFLPLPNMSECVPVRYKEMMRISVSFS